MRPTSPFKTIRGKVTAVAVSTTAAALAVMFAAVVFATGALVENGVASSLERRLDAVEDQLARGEELLSLRGAGADLLQVVDENGTVVASSAWAEGLDAVSAGGLQPGERRSAERESLTLAGRNDWGMPSADAEDDEDESAKEASAREEAAAAPETEPESTPESIPEPDSEPSPVPADPAPVAPVPSAPAPSAPAYTPPATVPSDPTPPAGDDQDGEDDLDDQDDDGGPDDDQDDDGGSDDDDDWEETSARQAAFPTTQTAVYRPKADGIGVLAQDASGSRLVAVPVEEAAPVLGSEAHANGTAEKAHATFDAAEVFGAGGPYLTLERGVQTPDGAVTIAAVTSLSAAREAMALVGGLLAATALAALSLVAVFSSRLVGRTLRPVEEMRAQAERISIAGLDSRLTVPRQDAELAKLAETFNAMLARLEAAVAEIRRFVSDASHELKSPVAAVRVMLETLRSHPEAVTDETVVNDLAAENERMGGIVGNLLLLARHDEDVQHLDKQPLDLCDLLYEEAAALEGRTGLSVDTSGVEPLVVTADHEAVSHAVRNVLDNAARYSNGKLALSCRKAKLDGQGPGNGAAMPGGFVDIVASDDGPGVAPEDRERAFGRFVRLEKGRSRKTGSSGLGLSVVRTIAEQHGGTAFFAEPELGGATMVVRIAETPKA